MNRLEVGYAVVNVDPPLGIGLFGYYVPRFAKGFLDHLEASTLFLQCGNEYAVLISIDNGGLSAILTERYRKAIEQETGIRAESIFMSATHTHTGPLLEPTSMFEADEEAISRYADFVETRLIDLVKLAKANLKPARMGFAVGNAPDRIAYIRRYKMKDGTTWTCPPIGDPNIDHPLGTLDQRVNVLRFDQENGDSIVLLNYGVHADTVGGDQISSDWPGWTRRTVSKALDGVKVMCLVGAQGDVGSTNVYPSGGDMNDTEISFDNEMKSPGMARFVGRALAGTILQVYDKVEYTDVEHLAVCHKIVEIAANVPEQKDLPRAHLYKQLHESGHDCEIPYSAMELTTVVAEALRMCNLEHGPEFFHLELTGVQLGPVALIGIPGEPFTGIGVQIKDTEGWSMVLPCCLTNGSEGYFPMKDAYDEGGYEARSSCFRSGVAERLIDGAKALLRELDQR